MPPLFSGQARLSSQPCHGYAKLFLGGPQWPPHPQGGTDPPLCCPVVSDDNLPVPPGGPLASFCQLNLSTQIARMVRKQNRGLCWGVWTEGVMAGAHPSQGSALSRGPGGRRWDSCAHSPELRLQPCWALTLGAWLVLEKGKSGWVPCGLH